MSEASARPLMGFAALVKPARTLYAVPLARRRSVLRFQLYEVIDGALRTVWPADAHMASRATLLPNQVFSMSEGYPAFHFKVDNPGAALANIYIGIDADLSNSLGYPVKVNWLSGEKF